DALFRDDPAMGTHTLGKIGSILSCTALKTNYPAVTTLVTEVHDRRGDSALSHPVKTRARVVVGATGRIKFGYLNRARSLLRAALLELAKKKKWRIEAR